MVHDPVMAFEDGTYYLYSTGMGIGTATSKDLKTWTVYPEGVLKDQIPAWTQDSVRASNAIYGPPTSFVGTDNGG